MVFSGALVDGLSETFVVSQRLTVWLSHAKKLVQLSVLYNECSVLLTADRVGLGI